MTILPSQQNSTVGKVKETWKLGIIKKRQNGNRNYGREDQIPDNAEASLCVSMAENPLKACL